MKYISPKRNFSCSYYNDLYDLKVGDIVYVEGKLEGLRGHVTKVNHTFKIKLSDYKRVISLVNTNVKGEFVKSGDCLITNDCNALPFEQVITWFKAPSSEDDVVSFESNESFNINNLKEMKIHPDVAQLGHEFYLDNFVVYIEIKGNKGRAIVDTSKPYEVEFNYNNGEISNLVCSCFCTDACKHLPTPLRCKFILQLISCKCGLSDSSTSVLISLPCNIIEGKNSICGYGGIGRRVWFRSI